MDLAYKKSQFEFNALKIKNCEISLERTLVREENDRRDKTALNTPGCSTVIEYREWAEEWRVRTEVQATSGIAPPDQAGERESNKLSDRGAKKIAEAAEYMHLQCGGFKTFVTGTFKPEVREKIKNGDTTIQAEVTRTMDTLQKMYQRGWTKKNGDRVSGHDDSMPYVWVVEVPKNEKGEDNPHVHMLWSWRVDYSDFSEWAERIERIWGNGTFHLEKIKDTACAGAYLAKAAGYLCKAQGNDDNDQGQVTGNRYGISKNARAPDWVVLTRQQLDVMGQLIADIYDHLTVKHGEKYRERAYLNKKLSSKKKGDKSRYAIGKRLAKVRSEIKKIPIRCNGYQVIIKGLANAGSFFTWLKEPTREGIRFPDWLPEKPEDVVWREGKRVTARDSIYMNKLREKFSVKKLFRRLNPPEWISETFSDAYWHQVKNDLFAPSLAGCPPAPPVVSDLYQ